ncbi:hypothetical protein QTO34_001017 [Cnephaeus nilssonii]|uniref:Uncharacterized protein n=1 Tax=Cnephaeus nilssonii TaxID=3371016 RepID=A0AA40HUX2_CNENI|nr:hypothetical protein QTO34_001017 [Eptesicus nilssonii]
MLVRDIRVACHPKGGAALKDRVTWKRREPRSRLRKPLLASRRDWISGQ